GRLSSLISLLLCACRAEQSYPTKSVSLGIIPAKVEAGSHVAFLLHSDKDIRILGGFWSRANADEAFILVGSREANLVFQEVFELEGLHFDKLKKDGRLTIFE